MGKQTKRNVSGLLQHAAALKNDIETKVNKAIDTLKRSKSKKSTSNRFRSYQEYPQPRFTTILSCVNVYPVCGRLKRLRHLSCRHLT
jgi:hypothetical protein